MKCYRCGVERVGPPAIHACAKSDIDAKYARDREDWKTADFPPARYRGSRDAALACSHALESAQNELTDGQAYATKVDSQLTRDAIDEALIIVMRARDMLRIIIKRIPT